MSLLSYIQYSPLTNFPPHALHCTSTVFITSLVPLHEAICQFLTFLPFRYSLWQFPLCQHTLSQPPFEWFPSDSSLLKGSPLTVSPADSFLLKVCILLVCILLVSPLTVSPLTVPLWKFPLWQFPIWQFPSDSFPSDSSLSESFPSDSSLLTVSPF